MAAISTNIKIDPKLKQESQAHFENLGLSLSAAVNLFLRQAVREQAIPSAETRKAIEDARNGVGLNREFHSAAELTEDLDSVK